VIVKTMSLNPHAICGAHSAKQCWQGLPIKVVARPGARTCAKFLPICGLKLFRCALILPAMLNAFVAQPSLHQDRKQTDRTYTDRHGLKSCRKNFCASTFSKFQQQVIGAQTS
jgi:hypothetical protein